MLSGISCCRFSFLDVELELGEMRGFKFWCGAKVSRVFFKNLKELNLFTSYQVTAGNRVDGVDGVV